MSLIYIDIRMRSRIHTSRPQIPKSSLPTAEKATSDSQKTTLGMFCTQTLLTFKETPSKCKAVDDRKYKLFEPSSENKQNADPEDLFNF